MLHFFSLSFSEAAHAYSCHTKNFAILTKFSDSLAEKLSTCKILRPYNSWLSHNGKNTYFCILMRGPMPCWTWVPLRRLVDLTKFWQYRSDFLNSNQNMQRVASFHDTQKIVHNGILHCTDFCGSIVSWQIVGENRPVWHKLDFEIPK